MVTTEIPNVNERDRIPEEAIQAVADHIAQKFAPEKIILFGSYSNGDPKPWSDVDLLVIIDTPAESVEQTRDIARSLSPFPFGIDLIVRSQAKVNERIALGDWFMEDVLATGRILYERTHG